MSDHAQPTASTAAPATPAAEAHPLAAYAAALGVTPAAAAPLAAALRQHTGAACTTPQAIAALDHLLDAAAARVAASPPADTNAAPPHAPPRRSPAAVRFTLARHLGPLLSAHPHAPADPAAADALAEDLAQRHDAQPGGVLPAHPHQEMPRQPLGALPAVLRSQFWSSAYRRGPFGNRRNSAAADDSPRAHDAPGPESAALPADVDANHAPPQPAPHEPPA